MIGGVSSVRGGPVQVGIGEAAWSSGNGVLSTVGLGSCVAVTIFDPVARVGGLLHFQLADGTTDPARAQAQPFLYGDAGIRALTACLTRTGAVPVRCKVHLAGGAQMMAAVSSAQIGKRNVLAARKQLWQLGYLIEGEVVGGNVSRSMTLDVSGGDVDIREYGRNP
jgi:chemotaxis protein CheD